ncbi:MAG: 2-hydroxyacyl-CoA dehydratase [Deltaproteobacteria bacterium]|nr:2-hydroxyacyl-CoA dehydratase [Deltaproteobacteria bacterium]
MSTDYRPMWEELGIDLEAHDTLMQVLGQGYKDVYHSQENRPEGMKYLDFVITEVHGLRIKELVDARAEGRKVVGTFCVFVPEELVLAVHGICVGLCAGAPWGLEEAERYLPRNTCSLIKGFFGFQLGKVCPYMLASDLIVGENTCDGKKKAYEIFAEHVSDLFVMDMPQMKSEEGRAILRSEYVKFLKKLEDVSGRTITVDSLREGIRTVNGKRGALHRLSRLRAADPAPISGLDALLANQISFYDDPPRFTDSINKICDELEKRIEAGQGVRPKGAPRILMSGCPMAIPNWKVPHIVESSTKAVIVGEESCVGERGTRNLVDDSGGSVEALVENIVDRYFEIDCAVFTPNPGRLEHVREMAKDLKADGVIHYGLQFCHPYQIEAGPVERALEKDGIPVLRIDTDYSQEDVEQIRTRVEAFVERIEG